MKGWIKGIKKQESPNHYDRDGKSPSLVVLHYSGGANDLGAIQWLCTPDAKTSAHFYISRTGETLQLVPLTKASWHAGISAWPYEGKITDNVNKFSIGIEMGNLGKVYKKANNKGYAYEISGAYYTYPKRLDIPIQSTLHLDNVDPINGYWEPWGETIINSLKTLLFELQKEIGDFEIVGHQDVALPPGRKIDPGAIFPWEEIPFVSNSIKTDNFAVN